MIEAERFDHLTQLLGIPFLAYVLDLDDDQVYGRLAGDAAELEHPREEALEALLDRASVLARDYPFDDAPGVSALPDGSPADRMRRFGWTDLDHGETEANLFRLSVGGALPSVPEGLDAVERAIAAIGVDYFPITLLPRGPGRWLPPKPIIARARVEALGHALEGDPLRDLLEPGVRFYTSTGFGYGSLWPFRVAECALVASEQRARMLQQTSSPVYVDAVIDNLRLMRELYTRGNARIPAVLGFWNVTVPHQIELAGPRGGRLRASTDTDPHIPMAAVATMVLDTVCDVGFSIGDMPPSGGSFFAGVEQLQIESLLISLAGLLSTADDEERAMPVGAWTQVFDPFQPYVGSFTRDPGGAPTVVYPAEKLPRLEWWALQLEAHYDPRIRVAVARCIAAMSERSSWDDSLIDLVIALENLFGSPGPKLELRLSVALATLLGDGPDAAAAIAEVAVRVYKARSKLVHGDELAHEGGHPLHDAERLVLAAFKALFTERPDLIADRKARKALGRRKQERRKSGP